MHALLVIELNNYTGITDGKTYRRLLRAMGNLSVSFSSIRCERQKRLVVYDVVVG